MLYDLLRKEPEMRSGRASALRFLDGMSRNLETNSEHEFIDQQALPFGILSVHRTIDDSLLVGRSTHKFWNLQMKWFRIR